MTDLLASSDLSAARAAGRELAADLDVAAKLEPYRAHRWFGQDRKVPVVHLEDVSAIPFVADVPGVEEYQHRARVRAGDGDVFVSVTESADGYERYCRETLRMGAPLHLIAEPVGSPTAVAEACLHGRTRERLVDVARQSNGLTIHPYMGIETAWALADVVGIDSQTEIRVIAPPPPVTWIANDKAVFDELVTRVRGKEWLVETKIARDAAGITTDLLSLAKRNRRVGLKRTRCASAMGNAVFTSATLLENPDATAATVEAFLDRTEWPRGEEVLSVAWLDTDLSPSTQCWIPPVGEGDPRLDGIYEQILKGEEKVFVGSRPSNLPEPVHHALGGASLEVAAALQVMGYVGRCSFDFLVVGEPEDDFRVVFMECNGRWGGTSTPMSMLDRLWAAPRPPYRAQDVVFEELAGASFEDLRRLTEGALFDTATRSGRFILYNVGPLATHGKFDVISIGTEQEEAEEGIMEVLPRCLGL